MTRPFVSGLVLAAGTSSRLGQPKQLLPFGPTTLLGHVVAQARAASALDECIVIIGAASDAVRREVDLAGVTVVENPGFGEGCAASYRVGLSAIAAASDAVAILLGDQPGVEAAVIDAVVEAWRREPTPIACAGYRDRPGHPLIFARALFPRLEALQGDKAAWKIVDAHPDWMRSVSIDRPAPGDVNTWEAYQALRAR